MTFIEDLASFAAAADAVDMDAADREALKVRILDAVGCALGALGADVPVKVRRAVDGLDGGRGACTLVGGGHAAPDHAALHNGALVRFLDFNDAYLAPGETCHPSDDLAAVLAAAEHTRADGRDLLAGLAVAYQVQCRLADEAPVRARGFDHAVHSAYAAAAGASRAMALDEERTADAVAMAATALNALRVTRTGVLSEWKGLAAPMAAAAALQAVYLAAEGVTGPREAVEGTGGFRDAIAGPFAIDWASERLDAVGATIVKKHNAEIHSQSAIEALLELRARHRFRGGEVASIRLRTFQVAYDIIGGGREGDKKRVRTKEEADHSLPYLLAVAALDGEVSPAQYQAKRILRDDVQSLLRRVEVVADDDLSGRFPRAMPARLEVRLRSGEVLEAARDDYPGFGTDPMDRVGAEAKFRRLAGKLGRGGQDAAIEAVWGLEDEGAEGLLARLTVPAVAAP